MVCGGKHRCFLVQCGRGLGDDAIDTVREWGGDDGEDDSDGSDGVGSDGVGSGGKCIKLREMLGWL